MKELENAIIISGEICSGKSTLAYALAETIGTPVASFGGFLKEHCNGSGIEASRKNLQDIGEAFVRDDPSGFLARVIAHSSAGSNSLIFEGVRHKIIRDNIAQLTKHLRLIYIDADAHIRYTRYKSKHSEPNLTVEQFNEKCNHPVEREIKLLRNTSDIILDGNMPVSEMLKSLKTKAGIG